MPIARVQLDDGRIARFEVPQGTTPQQAQAYAARHFAGPKPQSQGLKQGSLAETALRQPGLTARHAFGGISDMVGLLTNPINAAINWGAESVGSDFRLGTDLGKAADQTSDAIGLPRPRNGTERVVGDVSRAVAASVPTIKGGQLLARSAKPAISAIGQLLAAAPNVQAGYAAASGGAGGLTREAGLGPVAQSIASIAVPIAAAGALTAGRNLMAPMQAAGRERIAGTILADQATNPAQAISHLDNARPIVPGSLPTIGQASADPGLIGVEKAMRNRFPGDFGMRNSEQNLARQRTLDSIAGTPADIQAALGRRERITSTLRNRAFSAGRQADVSPVMQSADNILANPANRRATAIQAIDEFKTRIAGASDPQELYAIRQDIGDAMSGKLSGDKGNYKFARKQLMELRGALDDTIESAAPGFKQYLQQYRDLSRPINQMEHLQDIQTRSGLAAPDIATGRDILSQAKYSRLVDNALADPEIARTLDPAQVDTLKLVMADLDRGAAISSQTVRPSGSDTFQNMSLANAIGARLGGNLPPQLSFLERPFRWVFKGSDAQINQLLLESSLDPQLAALLMRKATPGNATALSRKLAQWVNPRALGAVAGAQTQRPEPTQ